ncbi:DUF1772 domain-containing protein [Hymenobacter canadensis]|uniref:DUF1772 domain-containing protein n=1 Tax=Hymenobacter canadensis TaxID=2999067 RepID=A0ABY7LT78_9BACT|nr:anthrone oxygenase family protein [Hymenobacter canadensis]WBA43594.1 DUF1772 domain-containing protein [Hymenobacter canadensis]
MQTNSIILGAATGTTGLIAGLFYGFSVAINPAFARLPDASYIAAMQNINLIIQNPVFGLSFFGAPLLLPAAALAYRRVGVRQFRFLAVASAVYLAGSFGVTILANIPLNEQLAAFPLHTASDSQAADARMHFARPWNRWHTVRTVASTIALTLAIAACLVPKPALLHQAS